jgi:hypothetical protein
LVWAALEALVRDLQVLEVLLVLLALAVVLRFLFRRP